MTAHRPQTLFVSALVACASYGLHARAQELILAKEPSRGWAFNNGQEFPGATGALSVDADAKRNDRVSLKLVGDFTKGGNYVEAGRKLEKTEAVDVRELSFWLRNPDADQLSLRLNDASGQTHQIVLKTAETPDWQHVVLPLEQFFAHRGQADAVTSVARYESWGGAKDGQWHGPLAAIYFLISPQKESKVRTLWLNEVSIVPRPTEVPGAEVTSVVRLDEILEGEHDWRFSKGEEFKGATGSFIVVKDQPAVGQTSLKLAGDFTGGGAYVAAIKEMQSLDAKDVAAIRLRAKSDNATTVSIQLVDGAGQTHQRKGVRIVSDGQWHEVVIEPTKIAGGEHWGGPNDGRWHGPARQLAISVTAESDEKGKQPVLCLADIRADVLLPVFVQPAAFKCDFEADVKLDKGWTVAGDVSIDTKTAFQGSHSLLLSRSLANVEKACSATSPTFPVAAGQWEIRLAVKPDLHSPDNSYSGVVTLECLDAANKVIERITVADVFGQRDWQSVSKRVEMPKNAASARFQIQINKTHGSFWVDDLSAAYLAPAARKDDRIARLLFSTAQLGNLLFPTDPRRVTVTVETLKPLPDDQHALSYEVRDYWGAEQSRPATEELGRPAKKGDRFVYETAIDLSDVPLEIGRYYELHAAISQEFIADLHLSRPSQPPFRNYTSFAILPEAATKSYKPEEIPFTARNWDNRISDYIRLSDRLGVRICGLWGGWSSKPPYKPEAPGLELTQQLGMGWLTGTPAHSIEDGKKEYDELALRQGARSFIEKYGKFHPVINLGNEPHGTGDKVLANVAAYRALYEEIKKADPTITVVATSVEPNEEYFKAGYGQWCDAYDFHIYEDSPNVRRTIEEYRALMKKYGVEKPIWSTELGLNSQGMTRHVVAVEVTKKLATFFAAGGVNVSWFGFLYPDAEGKSAGSSGDSHNIFDCRFNRYCPRLDAIAYYNAINAIGIKKFIAEKQYNGGINAFLFQDRDHRSLQVFWKDGGAHKDAGRQDVFVPLPGVKEVQVIRVDGSRRKLNAEGRGVTLTITSDPLLLLYEGGEKTFPDALGPPAATLVSEPSPSGRGQGEGRGPITLSVTLAASSAADAAPAVDLIAPPFWTVERSPAARTVRFTATPPKTTTVREPDFTVMLTNAQGTRTGELYFRAAAP